MGAYERILSIPITRREFGKFSSALALEATLDPTFPSPERSSRTVHLYRNGENLVVPDFLSLPANDPARIIHEANLIHDERMPPTAPITEGGATVYNFSSQAYDLLLLLNDELQRTNQNADDDLRFGNLLLLAKAVSADDVIKNIPRGDIDFATRFEMLLNSIGIDGIIATKSPEDQGRLYELSVWNPVAETWEPPLVAIAVDVARLDTYEKLRDGAYIFENNLNRRHDNGSVEPVNFPWVAELSHELLRKSKLPSSKIGRYVRMSEITLPLSELIDNPANKALSRDGSSAYFEKIIFIYPEYFKNIISPSYVEFSSQLSRLLDNPDFNDQLSRYIFRDEYALNDILVRLGGFDVNREFSVNPIKNTVLDPEYEGPFGVPIEKLKIHELFTLLSYAGHINKSIISSGHTDVERKFLSGFFFIENYPDVYGSQSNLGQFSGVVFSGDHGIIFSYLDSNNKQLRSSLDEVLPLLHDESGRVSLTKRIVIFHS